MSKNVERFSTIRRFGRWPEEKEEIVKTKQLMAIEIAEKLKQSFGTPNIVSNDGTVDILHEGYAFRLFLNASNGGPLIREIEAEQTIVSKHAMLLASISSRFDVCNCSTNCKAMDSFPDVLSAFLDEIIELMVAKVFCHPGGLSPPNSREVAFARFLELLCTHPLVYYLLSLILKVQEDKTVKTAPFPEMLSKERKIHFALGYEGRRRRGGGGGGGRQQ